MRGQTDAHPLMNASLSVGKRLAFGSRTDGQPFKSNRETQNFTLRITCTGYLWAK